MTDYRISETPADSWRVLEASGYVERWLQPSDRETARLAYEAAATQTNQIVVLADEGSGPVCTAGAVEETHGRWLLHNLGRAPEARDPHIVVGTILMMIDQLQEAFGPERYTVFADAGARHTRRLFEPFASGPDSTLRYVTVYRADTTGTDVFEPSRDLVDLVIGSDGANVAGFCNRATLKWTPYDQERLQGLAYARSIYRVMAKRRFIFLDEASGPVPADFEQLGLGLWWEFGPETMATWRAHLAKMVES